jgi:hypothetical protein
VQRRLTVLRKELLEPRGIARDTLPPPVLKLLLNAGALKAGMLDIPNMLTPTRCHTRKAEAV